METSIWWSHATGMCSWNPRESVFCWATPTVRSYLNRLSSSPTIRSTFNGGPISSQLAISMATATWIFWCKPFRIPLLHLLRFGHWFFRGDSSCTHLRTGQHLRGRQLQRRWHAGHRLRRHRIYNRYEYRKPDLSKQHLFPGAFSSLAAGDFTGNGKQDLILAGAQLGGPAGVRVFESSCHHADSCEHEQTYLQYGQPSQLAVIVNTDVDGFNTGCFSVCPAGNVAWFDGHVALATTPLTPAANHAGAATFNLIFPEACTPSRPVIPDRSCPRPRIHLPSKSCGLRPGCPSPLRLRRRSTARASQSLQTR